MVDFAKIADRAEQVTSDPAQFQTAYDDMIGDTALPSEALLTRRMLVGRMGIYEANSMLERIEGSTGSAIVSLVDSELGIDVSDTNIQSAIHGLRSAGVITIEEANEFLAIGFETVPAWPGLTPGQVSDALLGRQRGDF